MLRELGLDVAEFWTGEGKDELAPEMKAHTLHVLNTNSVDVIVSTEALGLGLDKPDVREVVMYRAPKGTERGSNARLPSPMPMPDRRAAHALALIGQTSDPRVYARPRSLLTARWPCWPRRHARQGHTLHQRSARFTGAREERDE